MLLALGILELCLTFWHFLRLVLPPAVLPAQMRPEKRASVFDSWHFICAFNQ